MQMTLKSKNVYVDKLDDIVNKYNNTCHSTIKMKLAGVESSMKIVFGIGNNDKDPKLEVGDHVKISKCNNIFAKDFVFNWSDEVFLIKIVKNTVLLIQVITLLSILKAKKLLESFMKRNYKKI